MRALPVKRRLALFEGIDRLGLKMARIDLKESRVSECSEALTAAHSQWQVGAPLATLEHSFLGLATAVRAGRESVRQEFVVRHGWRAYSARVASDDDGAWLLFREQVGDSRRAIRRRLDDREAIARTSEKLSTREMATMYAHELKQPIGSVANLLRGIRRRLGGDQVDFESLDDALERAIEQNGFAVDIINRICEFVDARAPRRESIDLDALVRASLSMLDWELDRANVSVDCSGLRADAQTIGDSVMLQQVLVNLIRNAIDAMGGRPPSERRLALGCRRADDFWRLWLADSGHGLTAAAPAPAPTVARKTGGMGAGLKISRSIIELHGGKLWWTSVANRGSTFWFSLPVLEEMPA
ncbi:MAG: sensor histidine kinase [Burkholderiaceae bacterium]